MKLTRNFRFLFSSIKQGFECNIPYTFGGVSHFKETFHNDKNVKDNKTLEKMLPDFHQGFSFAYDNLLQCIACKDFKYLKENLETRFFDAISEYPQDLAQNNKEILFENHGETEVLFKKFWTIFGVDIERNKNSDRNLKKKEYNIDILGVKLYDTVKEGGKISLISFLKNRAFDKSIFLPILQVPVFIKSKKRLLLQTKQSEQNENAENYQEEEYHKILFERVCDGLENNRQKFFRNFPGFNLNLPLFLFKDSKWKIADFDDFMEENDFSL